MPALSLLRTLPIAGVLTFAALGQTFPIATGSPGNTVSAMASPRRALASMPDGSMWVLVRRVDANGRYLELHRSNDGGATWAAVADTPTSDDHLGAVIGDTRCARLHVAWSAQNGNAANDVYHQEFDVAAGSFVGTPTRLTFGTGAEDQFYAHDVVLTDQGAVAIAFTTHRRPSGSWFGGWAAGLVVRPAGAASFGQIHQINTDLYGQRVDLQVTGEVVHAAFRTNTGLYGTRHRAFDTATGQFVTANDQQVEAGTSNSSCIAADRNGDLYVVYNTGGSSPGTGEIRLAYATAANAWNGFTAVTVAADPDLTIGNVAFDSFTLARTSSDGVFVVYSKLTNEQLGGLYMRIATGTTLSPEIPLAMPTTPDRFARLLGLRTGAVDADGPLVVVQDLSAAYPDGRVELLRVGTGSALVRSGVACANGLARLDAANPPRAGSNLDLELTGPANQGAGLMVGNVCLARPIDLGALGAPGCALVNNALVVVPVVIGSSGTAALPVPVPSGIAIPPVHLQAFALAPGANALNAVVTNGVTAILR